MPQTLARENILSAACAGPLCTLWIRRIEHRKLNRGCNRLPKLVQTTPPSIPFPVFNPPYPQGRWDSMLFTNSSKHFITHLLDLEACPPN